MVAFCSVGGLIVNCISDGEVGGAEWCLSAIGAWLRITCFVLCLAISSAGIASAQSAVPVPMTAANQPVDWWLAFKFNGAKFPGCANDAVRQCVFGGNPGPYRSWSQQFAYASIKQPTLQSGVSCLGDSDADPVGATFKQVFNGMPHYVIWNDQFYDDPKIAGCTKECGSPWGHSKGVVAWDDDGNGFVMQGTTPAWPISGRPGLEKGTGGNTLGCTSDNNVEFSQHYFALRLTQDDLITVLGALANASVVTDPNNKQIVDNGGPPDVQAAVSKLGKKSSSRDFTFDRLSTGIRLISKPSLMHVPPWQMVSSLLGGIPIRTANWSSVTPGLIGSTTNSTPITCWDDKLTQKPGAVEIATTGQYGAITFGLTGAQAPGAADHNHAKLGVSTSPGSNLTIFGDMNQQGTLTGGDCGASQNGRGGLFFIVDDLKLHDSVAQLLKGSSAPLDASDPGSHN